MRVGEYSGMKVSEAKPKIKNDMINAGLAYNYAEPDKKVVSRSGNEVRRQERKQHSSEPSFLLSVFAHFLSLSSSPLPSHRSAWLLLPISGT